MKNIFIVNKPINWTSNDVIKKIKYATKPRKIGHGGTLDPLASGVLVIGVNEGTKLLNNHLMSNKKYLAEITFGYSTETFDAEGKITNEKVMDIKIEDIILNIEKLVQNYDQMPPIYSALKYNGKPLYKYARENIEVVIETRNVKLIDYKIDNFTNNKLLIEITTSKGFYVRSFANDLGIMLGGFATLTKLVRTASGDYIIKDALTIEEAIDEIKKNSKEN